MITIALTLSLQVDTVSIDSELQQDLLLYMAL